MGKAIPNLVPVEDYENPVFPLPDNSVLTITLMNAPVSRGTAREMLRVLRKPEGKVILYGPDPEGLRNFEDEAAESGEGFALQEDDVLRSPFDKITYYGEIYIYGLPERAGANQGPAA